MKKAIKIILIIFASLIAIVVIGFLVLVRILQPTTITFTINKYLSPTQIIKLNEEFILKPGQSVKLENSDYSFRYRYCPPVKNTCDSDVCLAGDNLCNSTFFLMKNYNIYPYTISQTKIGKYNAKFIIKEKNK